MPQRFVFRFGTGRTGTEEAVTLRAVARQVGISAPSISTHFADREVIVDAIVDAAFADFNSAIERAVEAAADPLSRLRAGCTAYLRFAEERPNRYKFIFESQIPTGSPEGPAPALRTQSFDALVRSLQDCIDAGISASTDARLDSMAIWVALHGYATLRVLVGGFRGPTPMSCSIGSSTAQPRSPANPDAAPGDRLRRQRRPARPRCCGRCRRPS
jgi:AcrR family transcriptional regulator